MCVQVLKDCGRPCTPAPHYSVFTGLMSFLPPNQQRQSTEGIVGRPFTAVKPRPLYEGFFVLSSFALCSPLVPCFLLPPVELAIMTSPSCHVSPVKRQQCWRNVCLVKRIVQPEIFDVITGVKGSGHHAP